MAENRVQLGESSAEAARAVERDYDEIVTLLEAEVAHLRAQLLASPDDKDRQLIEYRRRCIMLGCQLNKAVQAKKVSDDALDVLTKFARSTKVSVIGFRHAVSIMCSCIPLFASAHRWSNALVWCPCEKS
jgi:hypothetical protein